MSTQAVAVATQRFRCKKIIRCAAERFDGLRVVEQAQRAVGELANYLRGLRHEQPMSAGIITLNRPQRALIHVMVEAKKLKAEHKARRRTSRKSRRRQTTTDEAEAAGADNKEAAEPEGGDAAVDAELPTGSSRPAQAGEGGRRGADLRESHHLCTADRAWAVCVSLCT